MSLKYMYPIYSILNSSNFNQSHMLIRGNIEQKRLKSEHIFALIPEYNLLLKTSKCFKMWKIKHPKAPLDTVTLETHIQYIAYIFFTIIFFSTSNYIFWKSDKFSFQWYKLFTSIFFQEMKNVRQTFFTLFH